ncbi:TPA: hypothetical protein JBA38_03405 [Legionella pneumophila]|uniref:hypothetical protein n=1 Tax=Legionella pneumophila TaxID=446 RepID=UPI001375140A|nr:hypothetical protein [Legionella pneumophila]HAT8750728.1 hypothetical protein [Legionella pneumophila]
MNTIYTNNGLYQLDPFVNEADLEQAIQKVKFELFGDNRIYLDIKKKIGKKGIHENIPDGYLLDLNNKIPRLYFVENELSSHDAFKHIAAQIIGFFTSFDADPRKIRNILFDELNNNYELKNICDNYISLHNYRSFDHFLDCLIENLLSILVIIDEEHVVLENFVIPRLNVPVDVIYLNRYKSVDSNYIYHFSPFLQNIIEDNNGVVQVTNINPPEIDTIVVPIREKWFENFLNKNRYYGLRLESSMRERIKYIACYRVSPISAITHLAKIKSIEPWENSGKWVINFEKIEEINAIPLNKNGKVKAPQNQRYTLRNKLLNAISLDDI